MHTHWRICTACLTACAKKATGRIRHRSFGAVHESRKNGVFFPVKNGKKGRSVVGRLVNLARLFQGPSKAGMWPCVGPQSSSAQDRENARKETGLALKVVLLHQLLLQNIIDLGSYLSLASLRLESTAQVKQRIFILDDFQNPEGNACNHRKKEKNSVLFGEALCEISCAKSCQESVKETPTASVAGLFFCSQRAKRRYPAYITYIHDFLHVSNILEQ